MYEKLSSNLLVLEKTIQLPMDLVRNTIKPFQTQAQEKNIRLVILENSRELTAIMNNVVMDVDEKKVMLLVFM
jgi:hypothetical protein